MASTRSTKQEPACESLLTKAYERTTSGIALIARGASFKLLEGNDHLKRPTMKIGIQMVVPFSLDLKGKAHNHARAVGAELGVEIKLQTTWM